MADTSTKSKLRKVIVDSGVRNLQEFGYPSCNADTITKDPLYRRFFDSMLEENIEKNKGREPADSVMKDLRTEIAKAEGV